MLGNGLQRLRSFEPLIVHEAGELSPLVMALIQSETANVDPQRVNETTGATGLMQLMPVVYQGCGINPKDPHENIRCGVKHLRTIQSTLHDVSPERFPQSGELPEGFARKCLIAGWVWKWSKQAGIAKYINLYSGNDFDELINRYDIIPDRTRKWINKVDERTDYWKSNMQADTDYRVSGTGGNSLILIAMFFLFAYLLEKNPHE